VYEYSGPILEKAGDRVQALQNYREAIAIFPQARSPIPKTNGPGDFSDSATRMREDSS